MTDAVHTSVTPTQVAEVLRNAGYRAEISQRENEILIQSACQGLGFFIRFDLPSAAAKEEQPRFMDFAFHCVIGLQGPFDNRLIDAWNRSRRFARMFRQEQLLILVQDVVIAGGVTDNFLRAQIEVWDRVVQEMIRHLKEPQASAPAVATA